MTERAAQVDDLRRTVLEACRQARKRLRIERSVLLSLQERGLREATQPYQNRALRTAVENLSKYRV